MVNIYFPLSIDYSNVSGIVNDMLLLQIKIFQCHQTSNLSHTIVAVVFAQTIEARYSVKNEDVVGAAPTGNASTTSQWSTMLLPTKAWFILEDFMVATFPCLVFDLHPILSGIPLSPQQRDMPCINRNSDQPADWLCDVIWAVLVCSTTS